MAVQQPANDRRLFSGLAELDDALGRIPRVPAAPAVSRLAPPSTRDWMAALRARGVPAVMRGDAVHVASIGTVKLPPASERPSDAAKRLVGQWTTTSAPHLLKRIRASIDTHDPRVTVVHRKGRIAIRVADKHVVAVTRFAVTGEGITTVHGDLTQASGPISPVATAIERALTRAPSRHLAEPSPALLEAVYIALEKRTGTTLGALAAAMSADRDAVAASLIRLIAAKRAVRVPLPSGHAGYRVNQPRPTTSTIASPDRLPAEPASPPPHDLAFDGPLGELAEFLAASGERVSVLAGGRLQVGGVVAKPPAAVLLQDEARAGWLDGFVGEHLLGRLANAAATYLPGLRVRIDDSDLSLFDTRARRVAGVAATHATLPGGERVAGNFLAAGEHWIRLTESLADDDSAEPVAGPGLHRTFPPDANETWVQDAEQASRRLRLDRTLVFAHTLRVDVRDVSVVFEPLTGTPLEVPFALERGRDRFAGALRIASLEVPIPCRWERSTDVETFALAWSLALTAYAELTCVPVRASEPHQNRRASTSGSRSTTASHARSASRSQSGGLPTGFTTRGHTAQYLASYVAGHRRRLQPHQSHSAEAAANAAAVGIRLRPNETWVQPHVRGLPADAVLHFAWRGPAWLIERDTHA
ncbi:hypothetical protein [Solirubrobacter pauli]|nr:hypothetical protein [Solirubrobacter pauli]